MIMQHVLIALSLGYVLCVIAKKQTGVLKTLGYTIGISIFVLTFLFSILWGQMRSSSMGKACGMKAGMSKICKTMPGHRMMKR